MSKNIVVVGGGTPNKFGHDFVLKAKAEGHNVIVISHKDHGYNDENYMWIDFQNQYDNTYYEVMNKIRDRFDKIDIILFNQNGTFYPAHPVDVFKPIDGQLYIKGLNLHIMVPHKIIISLLPNLDDGSKVVFTSSSMSLEYNRTYFTSAAGYAGLKSYVNHLMFSMATNRTKKTTFSTIMPHYFYEQPEKYKEQLFHTYNYIIDHDDSYNGKIVSQFGDYNKPYGVVSLFMGTPI